MNKIVSLYSREITLWAALTYCTIESMNTFSKNKQYYKFCAYGFLKNLRFFDAFFILFLLEKGLPYTQIGILYAVREIFINVFEIPSGLLADTYGRKNALMLSFVAYILSFIVFYISSEFWWFMLAFILYGVGDAFRSGTHKGMIMDYLKFHDWQDQKISYYGHTRSWSQKGSAISSLIAGVIVFYTGSFQYIFLFSIVPYLINLLLIYSYPNELNKSKQEVKKVHIRKTVVAFFNIMKHPKVLKIINSSASHTAYLKAVKDYIQPLMIQVAVVLPFMMSVDADKKNGLVVGVLYFFIYLATSRASLLASWFYDKNKLRISFYTLIAGFGLGILCGVFTFFNLWVLALLSLVGIYIIENIRKPILTGVISDNVPNDILTSVISAQSLLRTIMTAILALVFGILADHFGLGVAFIAISSTLIFISIVINKRVN
jgi:MFS family permease